MNQSPADDTSDSAIRMTSSTVGMTSLPMTPEEEFRLQQDRTVRKVQAYFLRFLFVFQIITQMYVTHFYLVDFAFVNCSDVTRFLLKCWAWHLCVMGFLNWLCLLYYRNEYRPAKQGLNSFAPAGNPAALIRHANKSKEDGDYTGELDRSNLNDHQNFPVQIDDCDTESEPKTQRSSSRLTSQESNEGRPLPWTFCQRCQVTTPPRTRHCRKCEVCIVRRDHHCELVGVCVGHRNQRFFVVLANYGVFVCYIGAYMTITYLYHHHHHLAPLFDYFLPFAFFQALLGNISGLQLLLTYHATMLVIFCPLTIGYFFSEMSVILQGKTMQEVLRRRKSIRVTSTISHKLSTVFGECWWLSFIFPTHLILPQDHDGVTFPGVFDLDLDLPSGQGQGSSRSESQGSRQGQIPSQLQGNKNKKD